jgi:hypothetical protein
VQRRLQKGKEPRAVADYIAVKLNKRIVDRSHLD